MKITRLQIDGILGIESVDVKIGAAVSLFCGKNGSGKSSIQEAVRMAITKDQVRDITVKKEFGALVHDGVKAGGGVVTIDNDPDASFAFNMPKGDFTGPEINDSMRVALHGQRFAQMSGPDRRTFLFELTKCKPNGAAVKARMLAKGCEEAKVEAVLPLLRTGFPSVCEHAKSKATEAKGAWRALTGTTYGPVLARTWEAPLPELPAGDAAALAEEVAGYDRNIASMNENLGAIKRTALAANEAAMKRATLADAPAKVKSLTEQLAHAKEELAKYESTVVALRAKAGGAVRVGLVHDMANYIDTGAQENAERTAIRHSIISQYEAQYGALGAKSDAAAQAALPEHEKGLLAMQNRVKNLQRDLDGATQQKGQFDALAPAGEAVDASAEVAEVEGMIAQAKAARLVAENKRLDIEAVTRNRAAAAAKTTEAMAAHNTVLAWTKVAEAMAPDGIPAEILADALAPVNAALEQAAIDTEWMRVLIGADMDITAAGRPYQLLSESEQWRTDAMIAQVVAELSGLKILMLDRVDVLDLPGRAQLFAWMDALADLELIDTALLFATLKALPAGLSDSVEAYWVENGTIAGQQQKAAA